MESKKLNVCFLLVVTIVSAMAITKMIHPSIVICKRNDPKISQCIKDNFIKLLPLMKDGIPEMNIIPIDPVQVDNVQMHFPETRSVKLAADMRNMNVWGISNATLNDVTVTQGPDQFDNTFDIHIPKISLTSDYKAVGKLLLVTIDSEGKFTGEFEDLDMKINWTSTPFTKKGRVHLLGNLELVSLTIKKMKVRFGDLFKDNAELTENINQVINENVDSLYDEISPVIRATISSVAMTTVNNVHNLFPFEVLFPKE